MSELPRKDAGKEPARTDDPRGTGNLDKVRDMLAPLGRAEKTRLFDMISQGHLQNQMMGPHVAWLLVELLNGARAEHARRLWTGWLDPILLRDELTPLAEVRLPAYLHVVDAGAWWFALSGSMEPLIRRIQTNIAGHALEQPLEKIFASAEAVAWTEELRRQSLNILSTLHGKPGAINRLVADANGHRARLLKDRGLPNVGSLTASDAAVLGFMLETAPGWKRGERSAVGADADTVLEIATSLMQDGVCSPEGAALLALTPVHAGHDPALAARVYRTFAVAPVRDAIVGHFTLSAQLLRQWFDHHYLAKSDPLPMVIETQNPHTLLTSLFDWYDAAQVADISADERLRNLVNATLGGLISQVEQSVVPAVTQRILGLTIRSSPQPLIERVEVITAFHGGFTRRSLATVNRPWVPAVTDHVVSLFQGLAAAAAQAPKPDQDVMALTRLSELVTLLGGRIEITAINKALIGVVDACLRAKKVIAPEERPLIERVVTVVKQERKRSKWWVSPEISDLLEIAEQRRVALDPR